MNPIRISFTPCQPNRLHSNLAQNNEFARKKVSDFVNGLSLSQTIYIYGESGVGKTHLINQMLSNFVDNKKGIKVLNAHCFVLSILNAIKNNSLESYRSSLKHYLFVIIEDIDLFSFKQRSQTEFLEATEYVLSH
jgi:chromosomal replication initiator protein